MDKMIPPVKAMLRALSTHTANEMEYQFAGFVLYYTMDEVQRQRFLLLQEGYEKGLESDI